MHHLDMDTTTATTTAQADTDTALQVLRAKLLMADNELVTAQRVYGRSSAQALQAESIVSMVRHDARGRVGGADYNLPLVSCQCPWCQPLAAR